jgi:uncharacterized BrkB/YihY/UPF0761 family membrane protein
LLAGSLLLGAVVLMIEGTHFGIWLTSRFNLNPAILAAWRYLRWGIAIAFAVLAIELLYHFGPNVKQRFRVACPELLLLSCPGLVFHIYWEVTYDTSKVLKTLMDR